MKARETMIQGAAAVLMIASALIVVQAIRHPPVLVVDETRDVALLTEMDTGLEARYARCKAVLLNVGAILAGTWPFEDDDRAGRYLAAWTTDEVLYRDLWRYRQVLRTRWPEAAGRVLLRTDRDQRIQIFRAHRQGFVANVTYTLVDPMDGQAHMSFSFDVQLVKTEVTPANPMGFALKRCQPLDRTFEEVP